MHSIIYLCLFDLIIVHLQEEDKIKQEQKVKEEELQRTTALNQPPFIKPSVPRRATIDLKNFERVPAKKLPKRKLDAEEMETDHPSTPLRKKAYYELLGNSISKDEFIHMQSFDGEGNMISKEIFATNKFSKFIASVINANPEKSGIIIKAFLNVLNNLE